MTFLFRNDRNYIQGSDFFFVYTEFFKKKKISKSEFNLQGIY